MSQNNTIIGRLKRNLSLRASTYGVRNWLILGIIGLILALVLPTLPFSVLTIFHVLGIVSIGVASYAGAKRIWSLSQRQSGSVLGDRIKSWFNYGRNYIQVSFGILLTIALIGLLVCMTPSIYSLITNAVPGLQFLLEATHNYLNFLSNGFSNLYGGVISEVTSHTLASIFLLFTTLTAYHTFCGVVKIFWAIDDTEELSMTEDVKNPVASTPENTGNGENKKSPTKVRKKSQVDDQPKVRKVTDNPEPTSSEEEPATPMKKTPKKPGTAKQVTDDPDPTTSEEFQGTPAPSAKKKSGLSAKPKNKPFKLDFSQAQVFHTDPPQPVSTKTVQEGDEVTPSEEESSSSQP